MQTIPSHNTENEDRHENSNQNIDQNEPDTLPPRNMKPNHNIMNENAAPTKQILDIYLSKLSTKSDEISRYICQKAAK